MRVLITGAGGFFGRALVKRFTTDGHEVLAADVMDEADFEPRPGGQPAGYVRLDVSDPQAWSIVPAGIEGIVHAAALTPALDEMKKSPRRLVDVNLIGTLNALDHAQANDIGKFLFISSGGVYDQFAEVTLRESDADGGFSLYGSAKLAAEIMVWRYAEMFGIDAGAVRPTSMYGPAEEFRNTRPFVTQIKQLVDAATTGTPVRIEGQAARCDWIYVDDVAGAAALLFASEMRSRPFNLSSGTPLAFGDVVDEVAEVFHLDIDDGGAVVDGSPDRPTRILSDSFQAEFDWKPQSLSSGLRRYGEEQAGSVTGESAADIEEPV